MIRSFINMRMFRLLLVILLFVNTVCVSSQEAESKAVRLQLGKTPAKAVTGLPDTKPPVVKILTPEINIGEIFQTDVDQIDMLGEVTDDSKIRFVSINSEIRTVNETGIFAITLRLTPGENLVRIRTMDEHNNIQDQTITIQYNPPVLTLADKIRSDSRYYGLIIGVNDYDDQDIPDLDNPIKDADALYRTLTGKYTFDPENIFMLKNPGRTDIIRELDQLRAKITPNDNLLIFYAGHGYWDEQARIGYWLPSNASKETTADWFRNSTLVDYLQAINSKHTLLITDACFAGSIFKSRSVDMNKEIAYEKIFEMPSRKAMTSGALAEVPDQSVFIKYLIRRLNENEETYLSSEELFSSFRMAVISNSKSVPLYGEIQNVGNEGGDFIFLKKIE